MVTNGPNKKFGRNNEVTISMRISSHKNVQSFLPGGQKKVAVITR